MAVFSTNSIGDISSADDLKKVKNYLYKLNEDLDYMFKNLTPEDNYSEVAKLTYVAQGEKVAQLEVSVDDISIIVQDTQQNYKSSIEVLANLLSLTVSTPEDSTSAVLSGDRIALTTGKFVVNSKNLVITEAGDATFSGTVSAAAIKGSYLTGGEISVGALYASDENVQMGPFLVYRSNTSGADYLATKTQRVGMGNHPDFAFWAGSSGDTPPFAVKQNGYTYVQELFPQDSWWKGWSLTRTLKDVYDRLEALKA